MYFQALLHRFRWLHLPSGLLVMLLQRTPVLRLLAAEGPGFGVQSADILKSAFALAALGAYNSVAGATVFNAAPVAPTTVTPASAPARSTFTATGVSGSAFSVSFNGSGAPSKIKSWKVTGTLPAGLTFTGSATSTVANTVNGSFVTLSGTPTTTGSSSLTITAYESLDAGGRNTFVTCAITITSSGVAPAFTTQPSSQTVVAGNGVTFTAVVAGTPTPTLQWFKGTTALSGKTSSTLSLTNVQPADAGGYKLVATNSAAPSGVSSSIATLTVATTPAFTTQPASQTVAAGANVTLTAVVTGTPAPTLQWFKGVTALSGKTSATLSLTNVQSADAGSYTLVATNSAAPSGVSSSAATLTVTPAPVAPSFTTSPTSQSVSYGGSVTFTAAATGEPAPTYVWRKGALVLSGQTGPTLTINPVALADAGSYTVTAINSAAPSGVAAAPAVLTVTVPAPAAISDPGTLKTGSQVAFDLSGGAPIPAGLLYKAAGLPAGLALNASTGHITGVLAAAAGTAKFTTWAQVGAKLSVKNTTTLVIGAFPSALAGSYEALLLAPDPSPLPAGKVTLTVAANGTFTGSLLADDIKTFTLKGRLALAPDNASASVTLALSRGALLPAYDLALAVAASPSLAATLSASAVTLGSAADGVRVATLAPVGAPGAYTALLTAPANLGSVPEFPLGSGYATATINAKGAITLSGKNADGAKLSGSFALGADHAYRLYAKPYATQAGGYLAGTLPLTARADNAARWHVAPADGRDVYWKKPDPAPVTANYPDGFGPLALSVRLEPWSKPVALTNPLGPLLGLDGAGDFTATLASTGLVNADFSLPGALHLSAANAFTVVDANPAAFTAKVNPANGSLSGGFTLKAIPPIALRKVTYAGVLLQPAPADQPGLLGGGFFLLPAATKGGPVYSGKVEFATP